VAELLPGGAVQVEVDGVVGVHEQLGDGPRQLEARRGQGVRAARATDKRGGYRDERQRKSRYEERERDGEQHQRQPGAAFLRRATLSVFV